MVREVYHKDLHRLKEEIHNMGNLVGIAIRDSVLSLKNRDVEMAQKVIEMDKEIDALDHEYRGELHAPSCSPAAYGKGLEAHNFSIKNVY